MTALLEVADLNVTFDTGDVRVSAVRGMSYHIDPGEVVAIVGESGSGKSTAAMAVIGLLPEYAEVSGSVRLHGEDAHVRTVSGIWPAANWLEREVWDLFGVVFDGHPDPRRLLMPEDWEGFPLRKDYPVQINMKPGASEPLQVTEQEFRANLQRDKLTRS